MLQFNFVEFGGGGDDGDGDVFFQVRNIPQR